MTAPPPRTIHHPTLKEDDAPEKGLVCFLDMKRPCGPDCMAWEKRPEGPDFQDKQWANCMLLVNAHRGGKHLVVLASQGAALLQANKVAAADAQRANQPPPPTVK